MPLLKPVLLHAHLTRLALKFCAFFYQSRNSRVVVVRLCGRHVHSVNISVLQVGRGDKILSFWFLRVFWYPLKSYNFADVGIRIRHHLGLCPSMGVACFFWLNGHDFSVVFVHLFACCFDGIVYFVSLLAANCVSIFCRRSIILCFSASIFLIIPWIFRHLVKLSRYLLLIQLLQNNIASCSSSTMPFTATWEGRA